LFDFFQWNINSKQYIIIKYHTPNLIKSPTNGFDNYMVNILIVIVL